MKSASKGKKTAANGTMAGYSQLTAGPAEVSRPSKKGGKRVLESIRIEVANNGFTVSCSRTSGDGDYHPTPPAERKPMVFEDVDGVLAYVRKEIGAAKK